MGAQERQAVRDAIENAQTVIAEDGEDPMYLAAQDQIRRAEEAAGPVDAWIARQSTY